MKEILNNTGSSFVWNLQYFSNCKMLVNDVKKVLRDQFIQQWNCEMELSNKGKAYKLMKGTFKTQNYFSDLPSHLINQPCWLRTSNHKLPVETGRWFKIDYVLRKCDKSNEIGDEYHVLLKCKTLSNIREKYIPNYFHKYPSLLKFESLMKNDSNRHFDKKYHKVLT